MSPQLELDLPAGGRRRPVSLRSVAGGVVHWAPAWLPALVFVQLVWFGLVPAWAEKARLDGADREVEGREERLVREHEELVRDRAKLSDEIYRERVRRSLLDLGREPLTLESTRPRGS